MGGNVSKNTEISTIEAFTLYGFGCSRCSSKAEFREGAPANSGCGTSCSSVHFDPAERYRQVLQEMEDDLPQAAIQAMEEINWTNHVLCSGTDCTASRAARRLNEDWCDEWNGTRLRHVGLHCSAASEVFGFGRSRVTYLVIRVFPLPKY
mmetsp:Transcript_20471/g.58201  ORF Transcript_20471/g.58201 Transcript_20471/m.58201 type:complete len:150 (+) Transcript_20471:71-520(+)